MKRRPLFLTSLLIFSFLLMIFSPALAAFNFPYINEKHGYKIEKTEKTHSIPAKFHFPYTREKNHKAVVHYDPVKKQATSGFIAKPFEAYQDKFTFNIKGGVFDGKNGEFTSHGFIKAPALPGKLYADYIRYNKDRIIEISGLRSVGHWYLGGFLFTPEELEWRVNGVYAKGLLSAGRMHVTVTMTIYPDVIRKIKLEKPVKTLIDGRYSTILGCKLRGGKLFFNGKALLPNGKVHFFKNIPVSGDGILKVKLPYKRFPKYTPPEILTQSERRYPGGLILTEDKTRGGILPSLFDTFGGLAALPGELLVQVKNSNLTMKVTSAPNPDSPDKVVSGYIPVPNPAKRVNVFNAYRESSDTVKVNNANMVWEVDEMKVPWTDSIITPQNPVKILYDENGRNGKLTAAAIGTISIKEFSAPAASVLVDNTKIDYQLHPTNFASVEAKAVSDAIGLFLNQKAPTIQFDFVQLKGGGAGFIYKVGLGGIGLGPSNLSWFKPDTWNAPSAEMKVFNNGYLFFYLDTSPLVKFPVVIVDGVPIVNFSDPGFQFTREPGMLTELKMWGNLTPAIPVIGGMILRLNGTVTFDVTGMSAGADSLLRLYILGQNVGGVEMGMSIADLIYVFEGYIELLGFKLFNNNLRLSLKYKDPALEGSCYLKLGKWKVGITYYVYASGKFKFKLGGKDFVMPRNGKTASYHGSFQVDGVTYDGTMNVSSDGNMTAIGASPKHNSSSGSDTATANLNINATMDEGGVSSGHITGDVQLDLNPNIPNTGAIALNLPDESFTFSKDPETGIWRTDPVSVEIKFDYTDSKGKSKKFDQSCQLRLSMSNSVMSADLDLPSKFGGTYQQKFDFSGDK